MDPQGLLTKAQYWTLRDFYRDYRQNKTLWQNDRIHIHAVDEHLRVRLAEQVPSFPDFSELLIRLLRDNPGLRLYAAVWEKHVGAPPVHVARFFVRQQPPHSG